VTDIKQRIAEANQQALDVLLAGRPVWIDVRPALEVVPGMTERTVMHSGPAIEWDRMCGPHRSGVIGAVMHEGLAATPEEALRLVERGAISIEPCHHHDTVGAGSGITSASMPMVVIENREYGNRAYSGLFESGALQGIKWGNYDGEIAAHLRWQARELAPVLATVLQTMGGLDVKSVIAKAVQMGDECHNRSVAASALFFKQVAPHLIHASDDPGVVLRCTRFLAGADHFFLHVTMAAAKALLEPAKGIPYSTMVTAMARNGVDFGIRVSGLGDRWFTAPANMVEGLYFRSGWGPQDAAPDLGDSSITETIGLGGMIQATAPTVQQYVQGSLQQAFKNTAEMREICIGSNPEFHLPNLDFAGAPTGIDIRKVVQTGITPLLDTAITHREKGLIGAGQARAPLGCFEQALRAFSAQYLRPREA
jgi:Protein of unknown function (DUF1116)